MAGPLTKSRFKLAVECPTKLHYAKRENGYRNRNENNEFLEALADGGHQVGMLAKYRYHHDPVGQQITVHTLDKEEALAQTRARLAQNGRVVIAEAALEHDGCLVRVDILIKDDQRVELIEVKSKSVTDEDVEKGLKTAEWRSYIYDIAFQTLVAEKVFVGCQIVPKLLLVNSGAQCNVSGLHQEFRIVPEPATRTVRVEVSPSFDPALAVNLNILREVDVSDIVARVRQEAISLPGVPAPHNAALEPFMRWAATIQQSPEAFFGGVSKACKDCEFRADVGDEARSGVHECWAKAMAAGQLEATGDPTDRSIPLSVDIWGGGGGSPAASVLAAKRAFIFDVQEADVRPKTEKTAIGFTAFERRMAQVRAFSGGPEREIHEAVLAEMDNWQWPLHCIDFETSTSALPFFLNMRPYQTVAFQFSHHVLDRLQDGSVIVRHANDWISTDGTFPNFEFVRALKAALVPTGLPLVGTVFRYHNHENIVLRELRRSLVTSTAADKYELVAFIEHITKPTGSEAKQGLQPGPKQMVDLHELVQKGYYSKRAGGSISLKYILPAILHDATGVAQLFSSRGVFGSKAVTSRNFPAHEGHVWLQADRDNDPYKTLTAIFGGGHAGLNPMLARLAGEDDLGTVNHGGLAMTAWNFTQFAQLSQAERTSIRSALLRYCELDTLAMVMLIMGLFELRGQPLRLAQLH